MRLVLACMLLTVVALSACRPTPPDGFREAQARYQALVEAGRPPADPAYDEVLEKLEHVPASSPHAPQAEALKKALAAARGPRASAPLARPPTAPEVEVKERQLECTRLARELGAASGGKRAKLQAALEACNRGAKALHEAHHAHQP